MRPHPPSVLRSLSVAVIAVGLVAGIAPAVDAGGSWPTTPGYYGPGYQYFGPYEHLGGPAGAPDEIAGTDTPPDRFVIGHDNSLYPTGSDARLGEFDHEYAARGWGTPSDLWRYSLMDTFPDGSTTRWDESTFTTWPVERNERPTRLTKWSADGTLLWENHLDWMVQIDAWSGHTYQGGMDDISASPDGSVYVVGHAKDVAFIAHFTAAGEFDWIVPLSPPRCGRYLSYFTGLDTGPDGSAVIGLTWPHSPQADGRTCPAFALPTEPPPIDLDQYGFGPTYGKWENTPTVDIFSAGGDATVTTMVARYGVDGELVNAWNAVVTQQSLRNVDGDLVVLPDNRVALLTQASQNISFTTAAGWERNDLDPGQHSTLALFTPNGQDLVWKTITSGAGRVQPGRIELAHDGSILLTADIHGEARFSSATDGPAATPEEVPYPSNRRCLFHISLPDLGVRCWVGNTVAANYSVSGMLEWATTLGLWPDTGFDPVQTRIVPVGVNDADVIRGEAWRMIRSSPPVPPPGAPPPPDPVEEEPPPPVDEEPSDPEPPSPPRQYDWSEWIAQRYAATTPWLYEGSFDRVTAWAAWLFHSGLNPENPPSWIQGLLDPDLPITDPPVILLDALLRGDITTPEAPSEPLGEGDVTTSSSRTTGRSCMSAAPRPFLDVSPASDGGKAVSCLHHLGIANGTGGGRFTPQRAITRAEMATFLWRIAGRPSPTTQNPFSDVSDAATYSVAVRWLAETGITTTASSGQFKPNELVTRGQMATFLWAFTGRPAVGASSFNDVPRTQWFTKAIDWLAHRRIARGMGDGSVYRPYDPVTREHMALFLNRLGTSYRMWSI